MKKSVLALPIVILLIVAVFVFSRIEANTAKVDQNLSQSSYTSFDEEDPGLGDGAYAVWATDGLARLNAGGSESVGAVMIYGREAGDVEVTVTGHATIGPIVKELPKFSIVVSKNGTLEVPIDFRDAMDMHDRQLTYTTRIDIELFSISNDDENQTLMEKLPPRYLAFNESGRYYEIMDFKTREQIYPYGFTTAEEQKQVAAFLAMNDEDGPVEAVGPGIGLSEPLHDVQ